MFHKMTLLVAARAAVIAALSPALILGCKQRGTRPASGVTNHNAAVSPGAESANLQVEETGGGVQATFHGPSAEHLYDAIHSSRNQDQNPFNPNVQLDAFTVSSGDMRLMINCEGPRPRARCGVILLRDNASGAPDDTSVVYEAAARQWRALLIANETAERFFTSINLPIRESSGHQKKQLSVDGDNLLIELERTQLAGQRRYVVRVYLQATPDRSISQSPKSTDPLHPANGVIAEEDQLAPCGPSLACTQTIYPGHLGCTATNGQQTFKSQRGGNNLCDLVGVRNQICAAGLDPETFRVVCYREDAADAGQRLAADLARIVAGLTHWSSDNPDTWSAFHSASAVDQVYSNAALRTALGANARVHIAVETMEATWNQFTSNEFWGPRFGGVGEESARYATAFRLLKNAMERELTDLRFIQVGNERRNAVFQVYIVGRNAAGKLVGIQTVSIESH